MKDPGPRDSEVVLVPEIVMPLTIRDLTPEDLPSCAWSGSGTHLASIGQALERAKLGEVEYLAACPPSGLPVALGGIDYAKIPGAGTIWQLAVTERSSRAASAPSSLTPPNSASGPAGCTWPSWASRTATRGRARSTRDSATVPTVVNPTGGTRSHPTEPSPGTTAW